MGQVSKSLVSLTVAFPLPFLVFSFVDFTKASFIGIFFRPVSFLVTVVFSAFFFSLPPVCLSIARKYLETLFPVFSGPPGFVS